MNRPGYLFKVLEDLQNEPSPSSGKLIGKRIPTGRNDISVLIAFDSRDHLHLLLAPSPKTISGKLSQVKMRTVSVDLKEWSVANIKSALYLDLSCAAERDSSVRRPFLGFCEDIISEIALRREPPEESLHRTYSRWKRFWLKDNSIPFTVEWLRGLFGEVIVLEKLTRFFGEGAVEAWCGAAGADKDFLANGVGLEVKTISPSSPKVMINNLAQLDSADLDHLFIAAVSIKATDDGCSLTELVRRMEGLLEKSDPVLDLFWEKLVLSGYSPESSSRYDEFRFTEEGTLLYPISSNFPRLTFGSFKNPPDSRISAIRYVVDLTGLENHEMGNIVISDALKQLCIN